MRPSCLLTVRRPRGSKRLRPFRPPTPSRLARSRFRSPHDLTWDAFLLPGGRHVLYATGGDSQDGRWVGGMDPALWLGDVADPNNPRKFTGQAPGPCSLAVDRNGHRALTGSSDDNTLRLWDIATGKSHPVRREGIGLGQVAFSPDERHAAYVCGATIHLCDLKTGDELTRFRGHAGRIWTFAFCGGGRRLVSGGVDDHTIRVWNLETGEEIRQMKHQNGVNSIAVYPDGRRALTGSWDRTIGVWDLETGQQLRRITGVADELGATVAVSPDGRRALFATSNDFAVRLWNLETGEFIDRMEGHTAHVWRLGFSTDGRRAVSSTMDKTVRVWALPSGRPLNAEPTVVEEAHFLGHDADVDMAAVSPDGRRVLSGSKDGTMILWDRETHQQIHRFTKEAGWVRCVAFAPTAAALSPAARTRSSASGTSNRVI